MVWHCPNPRYYTILQYMYSNISITEESDWSFIVCDCLPTWPCQGWELAADPNRVYQIFHKIYISRLSLNINCMGSEEEWFYKLDTVKRTDHSLNLKNIKYFFVKLRISIFHSLIGITIFVLEPYKWDHSSNIRFNVFLHYRDKYIHRYTLGLDLFRFNNSLKLQNSLLFWNFITRVMFC